MSGFMKYFDKSGKNMSFMIKDESVLVTYSEIWYKIKELIGKKLHIKPKLMYDDKYINTKVRSFNGLVHANFDGEKNVKRRYRLRLFSVNNCGFCYEDE